MTNILEVPLEYVSKATTGQCFVDYYWAVKDDCVVFNIFAADKFALFPICDTDKRTCEREAYRAINGYDYTIEKLPIVFIGTCRRYNNLILKMKG